MSFQAALRNGRKHLRFCVITLLKLMHNQNNPLLTLTKQVWVPAHPQNRRYFSEAQGLGKAPGAEQKPVSRRRIRMKVPGLHYIIFLRHPQILSQNISVRERSAEGMILGEKKKLSLPHLIAPAVAHIHAPQSSGRCPQGGHGCAHGTDVMSDCILINHLSALLTKPDRQPVIIHRMLLTKELRCHMGSILP